MKILYRISALLMTLLILSATFLACANTSAEDDVKAQETTAAEEEEDTYIYDSLGEHDFGGYEFRILSCYFSNRDAAEYVTFQDGITGTIVNDALYRSKLYVEDRFNITISVNCVGSDLDNFRSIIRNSILGNNDDFDVIIGHDTTMTGLSREALFYDLRDIEQFDFTKPWWPEGPVESMTVNNNLYTASNYMSYCGLHWTRAILFNKDYAEDYMIDVEELYNIVNDGEWYYDTLLGLITDTSDDVNANNRMDSEDQYGFATGDQCWYCLQDAMDVSVYEKDDDYFPYLTLDQDRAVQFLDALTILIKDSPDFIQEGGFAVDTFSEGRAMFAYTQIGDAYDYYRMTEVRYGFLPTPKLDENQENYINACTDLPWAIPITVSDPAVIGAICEAISCYNYNKVLPTYFDIVMKVRLAETESDAQMLQLIADTRTLGFSYAYQLPFNNLISSCIIGNQPFASYFAANELLAEAEIEELVEQFSLVE